MTSFSSAVIAQLLTLTSTRFHCSQSFYHKGAAIITSTRASSSLFGSKSLLHFSPKHTDKIISSSSSAAVVVAAEHIPTYSSSSLAMKSTTTIDDDYSNNNISSSIGDSFSTYLTSTLAAATQDLIGNHHVKHPSDEKKKVNFIMGNQAGDADSIISSLALSYVKNLQQREDDLILTLPIVCIEKEDMALRRDVTLLLQMAGITTFDLLVFLNDDTFKSIVLKEKGDQNNIIKSFTLVDHNKIRSEMGQFEDAVTEIYDHHQDEGSHLDSCLTREIAFENQKATVGSTCTIVTEKIMNVYPDDKTWKMDGGLGLTLLGVILLDTMNMNPDAAKGTPRDEKAIQFLLDNADWGTLDTENINNVMVTDSDGLSKPDRVKLYEYLRDSKFDRSFWQEMSARDSLRIDYKRFEPDSSAANSFGLSSVLLDSTTMLSKRNFHNSVIEYMKEVKVDLLGVLCMVIVDDIPKREMIMIGKSERIDSLTEFLLNDSSASNLDVTLDKQCNENTGLFGGYVLRRFNQGNPKGSRKQIAPVLMSFFSKS